MQFTQTGSGKAWPRVQWLLHSKASTLSSRKCQLTSWSVSRQVKGMHGSCSEGLGAEGEKSLGVTGIHLPLHGTNLCWVPAQHGARHWRCSRGQRQKSLSLWTFLLIGRDGGDDGDLWKGKKCCRKGDKNYVCCGGGIWGKSSLKKNDNLCKDLK